MKITNLNEILITGLEVTGFIFGKKNATEESWWPNAIWIVFQCNNTQGKTA